MKIKNIDMVNMMNILDKYSSLKLPQKISYAITRNVMVLSTELKPYSEAMKGLVDNYKEFIIKDDEGNDKLLPVGLPEVDSDHMNDYIDDINELLNVDVEVNLYSIKEEDFDFADSDRYDALSANDIIVLQNVLCHDDKEVNT